METVWVAAGVGAVVVVVAVAAMRCRRSADRRASERAHEAAREREPPVEIGDTHTFGVAEFTDHHSGDRVAVGKVEGFVLFVEDVPASVSVGDPIRARVLSFNSGHTSADAVFVERA
jgi:predicted RNA-binding protein with TRAM domain